MFSAKKPKPVRRQRVTKYRKPTAINILATLETRRSVMAHHGRFPMPWARRQKPVIRF